MAGDDFFKTRMGQRFYEAMMPKIADELERLNTNIEAMPVVEIRRFSESSPLPLISDAQPRKPRGEPLR